MISTGISASTFAQVVLQQWWVKVKALLHISKTSKSSHSNYSLIAAYIGKP